MRRSSVPELGSSEIGDSFGDGMPGVAGLGMVGDVLLLSSSWEIVEGFSLVRICNLGS